VLPPGRSQEDKLNSELKNVTGQVQEVERRSTKTVSELLGERGCG